MDRMYGIRHSACSCLLAGSAAILGGTSVNLEAAPPPEMVVKKMDRDGDGRISADEWRKAPGRFKKMDTDNNGFVTVEEIIAFRAGSTSRQSTKSNNREKGPVRWIDVHFHLVADAGDVSGFDQAAVQAIGIMDQFNIARIIAMPPPRPRKNFDIESIGHLDEQYADRVATIGGGGTLNPMIQAWGNENTIPNEVFDSFTKVAEDIVASGAKGFGEITAHHVSLSPTHGYEWVPPDNPLLLLLADIAAKHGVPIDFHFDPVPEDHRTPAQLTSPKNPPVLKENLKAFDRLLAHNRDANIVWAHAGSDPVGWFTPRLAGKLLARHPNLFLSIRPRGQRENQPAWHPKHGLNSNWKRLYIKYPDRFVIGTDTFIVSNTYSGKPHAPLVLQQRTAKQRAAVNDLLRALDDNLARNIGYENAIRIYRLNES